MDEQTILVIAQCGRCWAEFETFINADELEQFDPDFERLSYIRRYCPKIGKMTTALVIRICKKPLTM